MHEIFKRVSQDNHYFAHRVDAGIWTPPSHGCMGCVLSYYYSQLIFLSSTICISGTSSAVLCHLAFANCYVDWWAVAPVDTSSASSAILSSWRLLIGIRIDGLWLLGGGNPCVCSFFTPSPYRRGPPTLLFFLSPRLLPAQRLINLLRMMQHS